MSLGKTLLKMAIGVVIAKGVAGLVKGQGGAQGGGLGGTQPQAGRGTRIDTGRSGGLEDMLGEVLGSGQSKPASRTVETAAQRRGAEGTAGSGGLGDLLEQLSGQKRSAPRGQAPKGGLDDLLGGLTGRDAGGAEPRRDATVAPGGGGGVGDLLDQVLADAPGGRSGGGRSGGARPVVLPEPEREEALSAALMLRAVLQAVKCDGTLDEAERARLVKAMDGAGAREVEAVKAELQRPVDVEGLARLVPAGLEPQVYAASLMAIDLDQQAEADYLHRLAGALDLSPDQVNAIHDKARVQRLYR